MLEDKLVLNKFDNSSCVCKLKLDKIGCKVSKAKSELNLVTNTLKMRETNYLNISIHRINILTYKFNTKKQYYYLVSNTIINTIVSDCHDRKCTNILAQKLRSVYEVLFFLKPNVRSHLARTVGYISDE